MNSKHSESTKDAPGMNSKHPKGTSRKFFFHHSEYSGIFRKIPKYFRIFPNQKHSPYSKER